MNKQELNKQMWSAVKGGHVAQFEELLRDGADINARSDFGWSLLHWAAIDGNPKFCEYLLAHGAEVNSEDESGCTPLHCAAEGGHSEVCQLLVAHGANVNAKATNNQTPLHAAVANDQTDTCVFLLSHGADINAKDSEDNDEMTPLHWAALNDYSETCEVLLAHGADVHETMHKAVENGQISVVAYFLEECGEDVDRILPDGRTLTQLAQDNQQTEMTSFLKRYSRRLKTENAIRGAISTDEPQMERPSRSSSMSPL